MTIREPINPSKKCSVEGCEGAHYGRSYCRRHYDSMRKHGDPLVTKPRAAWLVRGPYSWSTEKKYSHGDTCVWDGCSRKPNAHNLCPKHYQKIMYQSRFEWLVPAEHRKPRCATPDCEEPV